MLYEGHGLVVRCVETFHCRQRSNEMSAPNLFLLSSSLQVTQIEEYCAKNLIASHVELNKLRRPQRLSFLKKELGILEKLYPESGLWSSRHKPSPCSLRFGYCSGREDQLLAEEGGKYAQNLKAGLSSSPPQCCHTTADRPFVAAASSCPLFLDSPSGSIPVKPSAICLGTQQGWLWSPYSSYAERGSTAPLAFRSYNMSHQSPPGSVPLLNYRELFRNDFVL